MMHLMVHLPAEAILGGPAQYRWMFPFERHMAVLKSYVGNKARPEGCIAERYIDKECLTFCSMYLDNIDTIFNKPERNNDRGYNTGELSIFSCPGRPFGGPKRGNFLDSELEKIHTFILNNCDELEDYINAHKMELEAESAENVDQRHDREFAKWVKQRVCL
ncbi:uncharacterized protein [Coffea arabica]|uniref:DUF4218 domain-containing protein n=1 Tax=Coffea arabica TaxID=13443 RepID=A0ABM4VGS7_COFAR